MTGWVVETLVASSALMLVVLALRRSVREAVGARLAYCLWALPLIRMIMPPMAGDRGWSRLLSPVVGWLTGHETMMGLLRADHVPPEAAAHALTTFTVSGSERAMLLPPTEIAGGAPWIALVLGLWLIGAAAFLGWHVIAHRRFCAALVANSRTRRKVAGGRVTMIETDAATGPLAFGLWHRYVAFPGDFHARYDEQERDLALAHELGHHLRGDLFANWAALIVLALHWFNPIAWRAFRAFRADQEMACDALVLAGRPQRLRHAYGLAIVKSAHGGAVSAACHLHSINDIKGRLTMLTKTQERSPMRLALGGAGMAALAIAGLGMTASGTRAAEPSAHEAGMAAPHDVWRQEMPEMAEMPEMPEMAEAPEIAEEPADPAAFEGADPVRPVAPSEQAGPVIIYNGKPATMAELDPAVQEKVRNVPQISEASCGAGTKTVEVTERAGRASRMVICTDRIERITAEATERAMRSEKLARVSARAGLASARAAIAANLEMTQAQRDSALAGIDAAEAELRTKNLSND